MPAQNTTQTGLAMRPSTSAPSGPTKPAAGVIATRPAMTPDAKPSPLGLPRVIHSTRIQLNAAAAVARSVLIVARPASPLAAPAEPALKPNQPTHSKAAPI